MDGSDFTKIVTTSIVWPNGLSVDYTSDRVWWCEATQAWWGWEAATGEYYTSDNYQEILSDLAYI